MKVDQCTETELTHFVQRPSISESRGLSYFKMDNIEITC